MRFRHAIGAIVLAVLPALWASAETDTVVIIHTNDLHDHIRADYDGNGGLPYVSGYIKSVLSERNDTLVLDGGDVMEKGDLLAFETKSSVMYEAMARIGYDAGAVGNHDLVYGIAHLRRCESLAQISLLCANLLDKDPVPYFAPSKVFDVDGVHVGVIGLTVPGKAYAALSIEDAAKAVAKEAERLEAAVHLLVVVCHLGLKDCTTISRLAPAIDVFVGGHSHAVLRKPVVVEQTGALVVQAGQYAEYVGRLELTIDLDSEEIVHTNGCLISMDHHTIPCDVRMSEWIRQREQEVCPEANRVVGRAIEAVGVGDVGRLAAAALRQQAGADIGLCLASDVIRGSLPEGQIDVNALFRTGGQRGRTIVTANLTGAMIEEYQNALIEHGDGVSQWSGFRGTVRRAEVPKAQVLDTDLAPDRTYRVVLSEREWGRLVKRLRQKQAKADSEWDCAFDPLRKPSVCAFTFTDALAAYVQTLTGKGLTIDAHATTLAAAETLMQ